jgi:YesN/AraC family two-component response regulator
MSKILVADDEMIERRVLAKRLRAHCGETCGILEAENGRQVLELWEREKPDVLILDIEMPGITGLAAAEMIRKKDRRLPIIFLTAFDEFDYARKAITVHALDYILKPYDQRELFSVVDEALDMAEFGRGTPDPAKAAEESRKAAEGPGETGNAAEGPEEDRKAAGGPEKEQEAPQGQRLVHAYIEAHYMEDLSVQEMSERFSYSEAYFCKRFKQVYGKSFVSYLTEYRIGRAKGLLRNGSISIRAAGKAVGYPDPNYFAKVFRRVTGKSPSDYRQAET